MVSRSPAPSGTRTNRSRGSCGWSTRTSAKVGAIYPQIPATLVLTNVGKLHENTQYLPPSQHVETDLCDCWSETYDVCRLCSINCSASFFISMYASCHCCVGLGSLNPIIRRR